MSTPVTTLNVSPAMCEGIPLPPEPKCSCPRCALASAVRPLTPSPRTTGPAPPDAPRALAAPPLRPAGRPAPAAARRRWAALPDVPTMDEAGLPGFRSVVWWAVLAPKGTPPDIIARLNSVFGRIVKAADVQERYASLGIFTEHSTPEHVTERAKADLQEFARILKAAGVEAE